MKVAVYGATGMVGRGVLRECLLDPRVTAVVTVGRSHPLVPVGVSTDRMESVVSTDLPAASAQLSGVDAALFCLGVSSAGMSESAYTAVTYDLTLAVARALLPGSPDLCFVYVSGQGTNASGRQMWQRVKGRTENDLLDLVPKAYMFRPGFIQALDGIRPKSAVYRAGYVLAGPLFPVARRLWPNAVTTTRQVGRAMLTVSADGYPTRVLDPSDINTAAGSRDSG